MNRAVISSDKNLDYAFFSPIVSLLWGRMGYRPLVFFVGAIAEWFSDRRLRLALERSREAGAEIHFIPVVEGRCTSTVAQVVRIFGASVSGIQDGDYLITSDMDMFPLGSWVGGGRRPGQDLQIWYANAYDQTYPHWPMCFVGAEARIWKEIVGRTTLVEALRDTPEDQDGAWNYDEKFLGGLIARWAKARVAGLPGVQDPIWDNPHVQPISRLFVEGEWRIDRSDWDGAMAHVEARGSLAGVADAHVLRPGYTADNWPRIRRVLEMALPQEQLAWVDDYYKNWMDA